jgi:hypothetical protein
MKINSTLIHNLDTESDDELRRLQVLFSTLSEYCFCVRQARMHRKGGNIQWALKNEQKSDQLYETLPESMKW